MKPRKTQLHIAAAGNNKYAPATKYNCEYIVVLDNGEVYYCFTEHHAHWLLKSDRGNIFRRLGIMDE